MRTNPTDKPWSPRSNGLRMRNRRGRNKRPYVAGDRYGTYVAGRLVAAETIAGKSINKQLPGMMV